MKKENKKKITILTIIAVITLIAVVVGATYAYFQAQGGGSANTNVNVQTATTDNLSFQIGNPISITANQEDFGQGMPNKSGSTTASATLTANNATNSATRNYYVYLDITDNDFVYTTEDNQAELLLKVTDPTGAEVTSIPGLTRKTSGGETGFDITSYDRLIAIAYNYEITASPSKTDEWTVEVIFVNLDSDQNANTGKIFSANLIIQEEEILTSIADVCPDGGNLTDCVSLLNTTAGDSKYTGLYYHDGQGTYINADQEAGDNSYRYSGANPNNYVCFGSDVTPCPSDNLYRIIGTFDGEIKLIKADFANSDLLGTNGDYSTNTFSASNYADTYKGNKTIINRFFWNGHTLNNTWSESALNTVNLNTNYINYLDGIDIKWANMIVEHDYVVGGNTYANIITTVGKQRYENELVNPASDIKETAKIGLMYVSDYGYSADPSYWTTSLESYNNSTITTNNWMYMGLAEWTISRDSDIIYSMFYSMAVQESGKLNGNLVSAALNIIANAARPAFYLNSNVEFISGDGSINNPFILAVS